MKRILLLFLIAGYTMDIRAQIPVVDVAALTEAIATVTELRRQVDLILREIALSTEIRQNTQDHLDRYERALSKRGIIPSEALGTYVRRIRQAHQASGGVNWENPEALRETFLMYQNPPDPLGARQSAHEQIMATLHMTLASLQIHDSSVDQAHAELERMKTEILHAKEPQQMRDVQANLQIVHARELLLARQALMTLTNMEAVWAADAVSQQAQQRMRYNVFVGNPQWLGNPARYDVQRFLNMPGKP